MQFPFLDQDKKLNQREIKKRIGIVTGSIEGPVKNNGIGTAYKILAEELVKDGHHVTVIFAPETNSSFLKWKKKYSKAGIKLIALKPSKVKIQSCLPAQTSYEVYNLLKSSNFDIVHIPDQYGLAYYSLKAKKQGLRFSNTTFCITLHSPQMWHYHFNKMRKLSQEEKQIDFFERKSVEWADVCIAPSQYILNWVRRRGWVLPTNTFVEANMYSPIKNFKKRKTRKAYKEVIFLGRFETRKGISLFCEAIKRLPFLEKKKLKFTLIGENGLIEGSNLISDLKNSGISIKLRQGLGRQEAWKYIHTRQVLVVIPSFAETFGYTFLECVNSGVPFIASKIPVFKELIQGRFHHGLFFNLDPESLKKKILSALRVHFTQPELNRSIECTKKSWLDWHNKHHPSLMRSKTVEDLKTVRVCVSEHKNMGRCLASLNKQDFTKFKTTIGIKKLMAGPIKEDFIIMVDGNTVLAPHFIKTLVSVAQTTGDGMVTCGYHYSSKKFKPWLSAGEDIRKVDFINPFWRSNFLIRKEQVSQLKNLTSGVKAGISVSMCPEILFKCGKDSTFEKHIVAWRRFFKDLDIDNANKK